MLQLDHMTWLKASFVVLILATVLFGNGIKGDFVLDDKFVIVGNPFITGRFPDLITIFRSPYHAFQPRTGLYRPVPIASYALNAFVFGFSPAWFHVVNIVLHGVAVFLVFVILEHIANRQAALIGALFFLVMPIHVEAVTSVVGRAEILASIGFLGALYGVMRQRYVLAAFAFLLGVLSKETVVAALPVIAFIELFWHRRTLVRIFGRLAFFVPPILIYGWLRYVALGRQYFLSHDATAVYNPLLEADRWTSIWTSIKVFALYIQKAFFPLSFSSDYSAHQVELVSQPFSPAVLTGLGIAIGLIILGIVKRRDPLGLGAALFLFSYFVISNWLFKIGTIMGERLFYIPSLGLTILVAVAADRVMRQERWRKGAIAAGVVVFLLYGVQTVRGNMLWRDERTLFMNAFQQAPRSIVNQTNRAYLWLIDNQLEQAREQIDRVLQAAPDHVPALNLGGQIYKQLGTVHQAEVFWKKAVELRPDFLQAHLHLGRLYYENGYFHSGEYILTKAVQVYPRWHEVLYLALHKVALEKFDEAIELVERHFGSQPVQKELRFALGAAYLKKGDRAKGEAYLLPLKDPALSAESFLETIQKGKIFQLGDF